MRALIGSVVVASALITTSSAAADVTERTPGSFTVKTVVTTPDRVFGALVRDIGVWWDPAHTFSGDAKNLSLVGEVGRCLCERLPNGGSVQHATVIQAAPRSITLIGDQLRRLKAHVEGNKR